MSESGSLYHGDGSLFICRLRGLERDFESLKAGRHIPGRTIRAIMPGRPIEAGAREGSSRLRHALQRRSGACDRV